MRPLNRTMIVVGLSLVGLLVTLAPRNQASAQVKSQDLNIAVMDDCDPSDPAWDATGGCALKKGTVNTAEFFALLFSPLSGNIPVGHPSWRNEPPYAAGASGRSVRAKNWGGRVHTFTHVVNFGGGFVPQLNGALGQAPECNPATVTLLATGETEVISGLAPGTHRFMCCIHPWMRAVVEIQ